MAPQEGRDGGKSWLSLGAELHAEGQVLLVMALCAEHAEVSICEGSCACCSPAGGGESVGLAVTDLGLGAGSVTR